MSSDLQIWHNPRCSKSRQTLELIEQSGQPVEIIRYLETPPSVTQLAETLDKLGLKAIDIVRKGQKEYKALGLADRQLSDQELLDVLHANPILIERPIVIKGDNAVLGRPPENVRALL